MKKSRELRFERKLIHMLLLILTMWLTICAFTIVSHAQSEGKVTADTAKIRKEASTSSEVLGSASQNSKVSINGQVTGSDGNVWYQVYVDASTLGYIRSDLVSITDGSTPSTLSSTTTTATTTTSTTTTSTETPADVTEVNPISATVTGGQAVRVRSNASTTSSIVTTAESGLAVTVTGKATGSDSKEWYQVNFTVNGSEVTGFIRSDYVNLSEELTEPGAETATENTETAETAQDTATEVTGDKYAVALEGEDWYLIDNEASGQYKIADIFSSVENNSLLYNEATKNVKSLKVVVIILIVIIIILAAAITMLAMKMREASDAAYYAEVERTTARRNADRPQNSQQRTNRSQGGHRPAQGGQKTAQNGQRSNQNGQRPNQSGSKSAPNGQKTIQNGTKTAQNVRKPEQNVENDSQVQQKSVQASNAESSNNVNAENARQYNGRAVQRKPKNFMSDDDEFEFEFLNWDGEDDK